MLLRARVETSEVCERRNRVAVFHVAFNDAVSEPQSEGRIRVESCAFDVEARARDLRVGCALDADDFILVTFAQGARLWINRPRELDHRIVRLFDSATAAARQLSAIVNLFEPCAANEF